MYYLTDMKEEDVDFVIAVSVGAQNTPSFKRISLELLDKHPVSATGYSFLTYNSGVKAINTFQTTYSSNAQVKNVIENIQPRAGVSSRLDLALTEAKKLFANGSGSRPHARKVVVIYTDTEPTGDDGGDAVAKTAKAMEDEGIQIIVVVLNMSSVPQVCEVITPNKESVIPTTDGEDPKEVVKKIDNVLKEGMSGKMWFVCVARFQSDFNLFISKVKLPVCKPLKLQYQRVCFPPYYDTCWENFLEHEDVL